MSWVVQTTDGTLVHEPPSKQMTEEAARADAERRNREAERLELMVRYEAAER